MSFLRNFAIFVLAVTLMSASFQLEAVTYVTDTGGYAYDQSRAVTNWAPAIALGTLAGAGIIAFAVQQSHCHSGSSSCFSSHYSCSSSSSCCRSSSSYSCHCY